MKNFLHRVPTCYPYGAHQAIVYTPLLPSSCISSTIPTNRANVDTTAGVFVNAVRSVSGGSTKGSPSLVIFFGNIVGCSCSESSDAKKTDRACTDHGGTFFVWSADRSTDPEISCYMFDCTDDVGSWGCVDMLYPSPLLAVNSHLPECTYVCFVFWIAPSLALSFPLFVQAAQHFFATTINAIGLTGGLV